MVPADPPFTLYPTDISSSFHENLAYVIIISFITSGLLSQDVVGPLLWNPSCHLFILSLLAFKVSMVSRLSLWLLHTCVSEKTHISFFSLIHPHTDLPTPFVHLLWVACLPLKSPLFCSPVSLILLHYHTASRWVWAFLYGAAMWPWDSQFQSGQIKVPIQVHLSEFSLLVEVLTEYSHIVSEWSLCVCVFFLSPSLPPALPSFPGAVRFLLPLDLSS